MQEVAGCFVPRQGVFLHRVHQVPHRFLGTAGHQLGRRFLDQALGDDGMTLLLRVTQDRDARHVLDELGRTGQAPLRLVRPRRARLGE